MKLPTFNPILFGYNHKFLTDQCQSVMTCISNSFSFGKKMASNIPPNLHPTQDEFSGMIKFSFPCEFKKTPSGFLGY